MTVMPNKYSLKRELKIINKKKINEYLCCKLRPHGNNNLCTLTQVLKILIRTQIICTCNERNWVNEGNQLSR